MEKDYDTHQQRHSRHPKLCKSFETSERFRAGSAKSSFLQTKKMKDRTK